ncbi:hypothetical protein ABW21_db0208196 [Orbilia brochopaga]|nr:hypothetical protein ABW21_db0208196 [Drechslerella brochopaga]
MKTTVVALLAAPAFASFNLLSLPGGMDNLPTIPAGQKENPACITAINATIDCEAGLVTGDFGGNSSNTTRGDSPNRQVTDAQLDSTCTDTCLTSLRKWIRGGDGCAGETFLKYFDLMNASYYGMEMSVSDVQQYYITASYWSKCLTDLSPKPQQSKYCVNENGSPGIFMSGIYNVSNPDALCKDNSCATQFAYLSAPVNVLYKYDDRNISNSDSVDNELPMLSLTDACPGIDTSKYPTREENLSDADLANGKTTSSGGSSSGNSNGGSGGSSKCIETVSSVVYELIPDH